MSLKTKAASKSELRQRSAPVKYRFAPLQQSIFWRDFNGATLPMKPEQTDGVEVSFCCELIGGNKI